MLTASGSTFKRERFVGPGLAASADLVVVLTGCVTGFVTDTLSVGEAEAGNVNCGGDTCIGDAI
jgi:hypothetical protein